MPFGDVVREQSRLKAMCRSCDVSTAGKAVYSPKGRDAWLQTLPVQHRWAVEKLHEELQADLEAWREEYKNERPHHGRWCFGRTLMATSLDSIELAKEKLPSA